MCYLLWGHFPNCTHKDTAEWFNQLAFEHTNIYIFSNNPKAVITAEQADGTSRLKAQGIIL